MAMLAALCAQASTAQAQPFAYIGHHVPGTISVLDTATNTVTGTLGPVAITGPMAVSPDGTRLYVPGHDLLLRVLDTTSNTVIATVPLGLPGQVSDIAINPAGTRVYLPHQAASPTVMVVLDTASNSVIANVPIGERASLVAVSDTAVYVLRPSSRTVAVLDPACNAATGVISLGLPSEFLATDIAINPAGTRVYVTSFHQTVVQPMRNLEVL
jgi:YVTN family beta-propeller protein